MSQKTNLSHFNLWLNAAEREIRKLKKCSVRKLIKSRGFKMTA